MAILTSKFDVLRGYPNGSALTWPFAIKKTGSPLAPVSVPAGTLVTQELQGTQTVINAATTPNLSSADPIDVWLVVEGNDDYSGQYVEKVAAIKPGSGVIWKTDQFNAGTYTPGVPVSFSAGKLKVKAANEQIVGHVLEDNSATSGTITISA